MVFYENGRKVRYNPYDMKTDSKVGKGEGLEVEAYQVNDEVVKFYKEYCGKIRLTKELSDYLTFIDTKRILLPTTTLLDKKHQIRGYKMTYIKELGIESFYTLNKKDLSKEMTLIHDDIITLSDYRIKVEDLDLDNTVFHNGIYLVDPGSFLFSKSKEDDSNSIYGFNMDIINEYLLDDILKQCCFCISESRILTRNLINSIQEDIHDRNLEPLTYLMNGMEYDSILELVRHKCSDLKSGGNEKAGVVQKVKCRLSKI